MKTIPTLLSGPPGVGKTAMAYAVGARDKAALATIGASDIEREVIYIPLCERDPMEIAGASYLVDSADGTKVVDWAPSRAMRTAQERPCVVILDELTAAHRVQRVAALRYADPSSGLHPETIVIATCNPPEYAAGAGDPLSAPEVSRFRIREHGPDAAIRWMCGQPGQVGDVGRFLRAHPRVALASPESMQRAVERQAPFPTPRGWTRCAESGLPVDDWSDIIGDDGPPQYIIWTEQRDLPNPDDILSGRLFDVPERPDSALAVATSIVEMLGEDCEDSERINNAIVWFDHASNKHAGIISCEADVLADRYLHMVYQAGKRGLWSKWARMQEIITDAC